MKQLVVAFILSIVALTAFAQNKKSNNVSLVLPFNSKQIIENPNYKGVELGNICREYYQGVLVALDSFERAEISVRLSVFDTEDDSVTLLNIMKKPTFKESELIIGPVRQNGNQVLTQFCDKNNLFHVSPLMTFSKTKFDDPLWISANPDLPIYANIILKQILALDTAANIIVVYDKSIVGKSVGQAFKTLSANKKLRIKVIEYNSALDLKLYASTLYANHIVVAATQQSAVNGTLRSMGDTASINKLSTYGFMQWLDFKNVDYNLYQRCNLFVFSPFFIDYTRTEVKQFVAAYRERFNTEPTEAAVKGYDQMLMLTHALNTSGKRFMEDLKDKNIRTLGTTYNFTKQFDNRNYQTNYLNLLKLTDYKLIPVN